MYQTNQDPNVDINTKYFTSQENEQSTFALANTNQTITMQKLTQYGDDTCLKATFRLILNDSPSSDSELSSIKDIIGKLITLEPFDFPGMVVAHQGEDDNLVVADNSSGKISSLSVFRVNAGLDGRDETVSLESQSKKGCFVYNVNRDSSGSLKLSCNFDDSDLSFKKAASFVLDKGLSEYHPISFVAKGASRNFLLAPLLSLRDESYTVYFNMWA